MADVVHRITVEYRRSVNTVDYPPADWLHNPDLAAVTDPNTGRLYPNRYWKVVDDRVELMTEAERDAVDQARKDANTLDDRDTASGVSDDESAPGMQNRALLGTLNLRDNYLTNRILELQEAVNELRATFDAVKASAGPADNIRAAIPGAWEPPTWSPTSTRPRSEAIAEYQEQIQQGGADSADDPTPPARRGNGGGRG